MEDDKTTSNNMETTSNETGDNKATNKTAWALYQTKSNAMTKDSFKVMTNGIDFTEPCDGKMKCKQVSYFFPKKF